MIKNYLLITFRNFLRNLNYTVINILGLSIGLTSCIVIFLLIRFDTSFDKFHQHYDRIYQVVRETKSGSGVEYSAVTPYPFANAFRQDFTDVPLMTQMHYHDEVVATIGSEKSKIEQVLFADSLFFKVFDFGVVSGNPGVDLGKPNKVFLTESLAAALNIGEGDRMKVDNVLDLEVAGLIRDVPANSHIQYKMVISMPSFTNEFFTWGVNHWGLTSSGYSYLVLPENMAPEQVVNRFPDFVSKYYRKDDEERNVYLLQPLSEVHLNEKYDGTPGNVAKVNINNLYVLAILGFFILVIASINFVNLATALAVKKSKEIGIRKTLGARRPQLTLYFLTETFAITLCAVIISLGLVEWILPWLRNFTEKEIYLGLFSDGLLAFFLLVLGIVTTILSGFYPGLILAGFDPVAVLKNRINAQGTSGSSVRRVLVILQFVIAQMMIIGTLIVSDQMRYFQSKPLGFRSEAIITVPLPKNDENLLNNLRARLISDPNIQEVSYAIGAPTADSNIGTRFYLTEKGSSENFPVQIKTIDRYYKELYGIEMHAGRWFSESDEKMAMDTSLTKEQRYGLIVNEAAVRRLGINTPEQAIDKKVHIGVNDIQAPIIGVTKDFHTSSLHAKIEPIVMLIMPDLYFSAGISMKGENFTTTIERVRENWQEVYPEYYFEYEFLDEHLASRYRSEQRQLVLFRIFSGLSIFIGCLGLLGLVSFMANQKLKEIGVRKVFGASILNIVKIFSKEFILLVGIAFLIAAPLSWMVMQQWLQNFEYHIEIHWSAFAIGLFVTLLIALSTVLWRAVRAGMTNPIDSLRVE